MASTQAAEQKKPLAEFEETLVAAETTPEPEAAPADLAPEPELPPLEPTPLLEPMPEEPAPLEALEPEPETPADPLPVDLPPELAKYVVTDGPNLVVKEPYLDSKTKAELERRLGGRRARLHELRWAPRKRESVREVAKGVDDLAWKPQYQPKAVTWLKKHEADRAAAAKGLERIPANIVDKRVVYETEGGFVVEVTYRELGDTGKKYFVVPAKAGRTAALEAVRSGNYAQAVLVGADLVDALARGAGHARGALKPGRVATWPITNKHPVGDLHGVSHKRIVALAQLGIKTTDQLRVRSATIVARHVGVTGEVAQRWIWAAEVLPLKALGPRYAYALAQAGIRGLDDLRERSPSAVSRTVNAWLEGQKGRKFVPPVGPARARGWIAQARRLRKRVQAFPA